MSNSGLGKSHLESTKMSNVAADLLEQLATSLSRSAFVPHVEEFEVLAHPQHQLVKPLLAELGLSEKRFQIIRVPGPKSTPIWNSTGPAHIIPAIIMEDSKPTVSEKRLILGEIICIKHNVNISPKVVFLMVQE